MIKRVRAVLVTSNGCMLAIRQGQQDQTPCRVLPGGRVNPGDRSREAALARRDPQHAYRGQEARDNLCRCRLHGGP
jgi:hypothetical protein